MPHPCICIHRTDKSVMKALPVATLRESMLLFVALVRNVCLERPAETVLPGLAEPV
jgi:hypothetical protein